VQRIMALVNTDSPEHRALELALALLQDHGDTIDVVTTLREAPGLLTTLWKNESKDYQHELLISRQTALGFIAQSHQRPGVTLNTYILQGKPFVEIIHLAEKNGADLLVTDESVDYIQGSDLPHGNTNFQLLRKCPIPIWMSDASQPLLPTKVVAAVDVQRNEPENMRLNTTILVEAADIAARYHAEFHIVQAWEMFGESMITHREGLEACDRARGDYLARVKADVESLLRPLTEGGATFQLHLMNGPPERVIPYLVKNEGMELIVMGTVGRSGIRGFVMGNTAENILRSIKCSVLALKPDGFQSPIT